MYNESMTERSVISIGNTYRIKQVMEKARRGEKVTIAYLGASITKPWSGHDLKGYVEHSYQFFQKKYGRGGNIRLVNSGMNGTTSVIGLMRLERDILSEEPDIVFVDFAVNDFKDQLHRETYESMLCRILNSRSKPAVVLLFMSAETGYSAQGHMQAIGEHYRLGMISVGDGIFPEIKKGTMKWREYSDDNIHPNESGNRMIAEMIAGFYRKVQEAPNDPREEFPDNPFFGRDFEHIKVMDSSNAVGVFTGSFCASATIKEFGHGWVHSPGAGNQGFELMIYCKSLFILYKESNREEEGGASVRIDGEMKYRLSGHRLFGWNNPVAQLVIREQEAAEHRIEISMVQGDENKEFTILAFGYCE